MRRYISRLAMFASLALAVTACGSTTGATTGGWTHASAPPTTGAAQPVVAAPQSSPGRRREDHDRGVRPRFHASDAHGAGGRHVRGRVQEHRLDPPRRHLRRRHEDQRRGRTRARPARSRSRPAGLAFLCSIPGHADAGMKGEVMVASERPRPPTPAARSPRRTPAAPVADPNAPKYTLVRRRRRPSVLDGHRP